MVLALAWHWHWDFGLALSEKGCISALIPGNGLHVRIFAHFNGMMIVRWSGEAGSVIPWEFAGLYDHGSIMGDSCDPQ